ncbi:MAG: hypothetical protein RSD99_17805, partial [Janthinobacterium sp.]
REIINEQYVLEIDSSRKLDKVVHLPSFVSHGRHKINKRTLMGVEGANEKRPEDPAVPRVSVANVAQLTVSYACLPCRRRQFALQSG